MPRLIFLLGVSIASWTFAAAAPQPVSAGDAKPAAATVYHIYAGSTHAHTSFTWSHGDQYVKQNPAPGEKKGGISVDENGAQTPSKAQVLKPDWEKFQGPPPTHLALAKTSG